MSPERTLLTLVTDRRLLPPGASLAGVVREAAAAGVDRVQVREKDLSGRELFHLVEALVEAAAGTAAEVAVSGRPDVARAAGARGVQLPEDGLPPGAVKAAFPELTVGASRHTLEGALAAEAEGADFVVLGPVFPTPGKEQRALGLAALEQAARRLRVPVHAVGGIAPQNARAVAEAGARGILAIRALLAPSPAEAVRRFREALA